MAEEISEEEGYLSEPELFLWHNVSSSHRLPVAGHSAAVIDSQSVKRGLPKSQEGIDGGKKVKGIKRNIAVDCGGLPLEIVVTQANMHDSKAANALIARTCHSYSTVQLVKADFGYRGSLVQRVKQTLGIDVDCVKSNFGASEFVPVEGQWVVERTISWLDNFRSLARNYEQYIHTAEAMACMAFLAILQPKH